MVKRTLTVREHKGRVCIQSVVTKGRLREIRFLPVDVDRSHSFDQLRVLTAVEFPWYSNLRVCAESGADETVHLLYGRSDSVDVDPTNMLYVCEVVAPQDDDAVLDVCTTCTNPVPMIFRKRDWRGYCYRCHALKVVTDRPTPQPPPDQLGASRASAEA